MRHSTAIHLLKSGVDLVSISQWLGHASVNTTNRYANHWAEQAIRPAVVTRKIWGGNRTWRGAETQGILATTFRTCQQQGVDPQPIITELLRSRLPRLASLPSLASGP